MTAGPRGPTAGPVLDLRAVAQALQQHGHCDTCELRVIGTAGGTFSPTCTCGHAGALALLVHARALRAALEPFARHGMYHLTMLEEAAKKEPKWQPEDSHPAVCSYCMGKDEALYTWGDLRRAAVVLAAARDGETP